MRVTRRVVAQQPEPGWEATLREFEEKYAEGVRTLQEQAEFTELGAQFFGTLESPVE